MVEASLVTSTNRISGQQSLGRCPPVAARARRAEQQQRSLGSGWCPMLPQFRFAIKRYCRRVPEAAACQLGAPELYPDHQQRRQQAGFPVSGMLGGNLLAATLASSRSTHLNRSLISRPSRFPAIVTSAGSAPAAAIHADLHDSSLIHWRRRRVARKSAGILYQSRT